MTKSEVYILGRKDEGERPTNLCANPRSICVRCSKRPNCSGADTGAYVSNCDAFNFDEHGDKTGLVNCKVCGCKGAPIYFVLGMCKDCAENYIVHLRDENKRLRKDSKRFQKAIIAANRCEQILKAVL